MSENRIKEQLLNTLSKPKWEKVGLYKRSGVLVPLFSVYSQRSIGVGDFEDLKLLIDWAKKTGNSIIQLLPMNEVGSVFCPYDSISSFALEPLYICLDKLKEAKNPSIRAKIENLRKKFPCGKKYVDYGIKEGKISILKEMFIQGDFTPEGEFNEFIKNNAYWIEDFALYKSIKDSCGYRAWYDWDEVYKNRDLDGLRDFSLAHKQEILFYMWVQWQLYKQFKEVKEYGQAKKVLINGDLPVLVSRDSSDVWAKRNFFKLEFAAGAPVDMYCAKGQRWGMPTYNWDNISSANYEYIKEKLKYAENFYDILRIDHVVGLFRIWSIPYGEPEENKGLNGFFDPKEESKWAQHGSNILSVMTNSTEMLLCAEDLGIIPQVCPKILKKFGIPGNDVQRWAKDWNIKHDFLEPEEYRVLSVAVLSTHDTTNWAAWWENEVGTIDEALFIRKCIQYKIDYDIVKAKLFNLKFSRNGRLRWLDSVSSLEILMVILAKKKDEIPDLVDVYLNTFREKEKLWGHLRIKGLIKEQASATIQKAVFNIVLQSQAIFCINSIFDWLNLGGVLNGDLYQYRINTPGTVSDKNWSLVVPIALEDLLNHEISEVVKTMVIASGRYVE